MARTGLASRQSHARKMLSADLWWEMPIRLRQG